MACLVGVATATVSRVINSPEQVDAETRQLVRDAVLKLRLRYLPHGATRALRSHRSKMVGAVVPSFGCALYARTTSAAKAVLDPLGYALVLAEHHSDLKAELRITEQLIGPGVDVFVGLDHGARRCSRCSKATAARTCSPGASTGCAATRAPASTTAPPPSP